jgi:hypothetical protein
MAFRRDKVLNNLARIIQVIRNDRKLHEWFSRLAHKSTVERRNEIYAMLERMRAEGEDAELMASLQLLSDSKVFEAARMALGEPGSNTASYEG